MYDEPKMYFREPRHRAYTQIVVSARGFGRYFSLRNVSQSGACLVGDKQLRVGEPVTLILGNISINAVVQWVSDRHLGVRFEATLERELFKLILKQVRPFKKKA